MGFPIDLNFIGKKLLQSLELAGEVTHQLGLPCDFQTAFDGMTTVIDILQGGGNHVHVIVSIDAARDTEAHEIKASEAVLAGYRVAVGKHIADFAGADASLQIELACQRLGRELLLGI